MMTWQQFKVCMEAAGVTDDTRINYIDIAHPMALGDGRSDMQVKVKEFNGRAEVTVGN